MCSGTHAEVTGHDQNKIFGALFGGSLSLLSILVGVFTLALAKAIQLKGGSGALPWYALLVICGISVLATSGVSYCCYKRKGLRYVQIVFPIILFLLGICIPILGLIIFVKA